MRQILIAAAALIALTAQADAASRIPAPQTSAVQLTGGLGNGLRPALPADGQVAQIAPARGE
ncbi:hypothetical protein KTR66_00705 [Roseococcus sp. SDR]|uniref:hypothetical protein n=1 Tax=Roseococcus sp. SDR TaxID=2835532 RepID=UPI001BCCDECF|nr:hypothetical protein [Roseococcus sp. SDR]MBS7788489.1 hypothetical protein [Roseococcus sp. SDR]MBV1843803.1 hypothetical protein [Roseococcus sp. SDR]